MQLQRIQPELDERKTDLIVIGNGPAWAIEGFRDKSGYKGPIYTDPSRKTFEALEMNRGMGSVLRWGSIKSTARALRSGHRQSKTQGDPLQQGGMVLLDPSGQMSWVYRSKFAGDHPTEQTIFEAIDSQEAA